jgi:hypothetical protein
LYVVFSAQDLPFVIEFANPSLFSLRESFHFVLEDVFPSSQVRPTTALSHWSQREFRLHAYSSIPLELSASAGQFRAVSLRPIGSRLQ